jgi:hypothetical protein
MSISLNTQIAGNAYQTNLSKPKISKENEILKNQIVAIGMTNPDRASMLSRKIVMWDGSQKALDELSSEGLNVSHLVVGRLLGGMMESSVNIDFITNGIDKSNIQTKKAHGKDCILLIGDTGVGKSTLANAIVKGPKSLKLINIEVQGEFGSYMDATIDTDNPIKEQDGSTIFKIGHGKAKSQTQHPEIFVDNNAAYCDCPGFGDTSGSNRDIVNCVGIKDILDNAKSVRIMIALSALQILDSSGRGQSIRNAVSTLNSIFAEKDFTRYMNSITPVILRCPPGVPVQKLQQSLFESLQNESLSSVAKELARKLIMVDPLERKQCQGELDLTSFKKVCNSGIGLESKNFGNPLTPESMLKINSIFDETRSSIKDYADKGKFNEAEKQLEVLKKLKDKKVPLVSEFYSASYEYVSARKQFVENKSSLEDLTKTRKTLYSKLETTNADIAKCTEEIKNTEKIIKESGGFFNSLGRGFTRVCAVVNYVNPVAYAIDGVRSAVDQENHMMETTLHGMPKFEGEKAEEKLAILQDHLEKLQKQSNSLNSQIKASMDAEEVIRKKL